MSKTAIYARVSTETQSLDRQLEACLDVAGDDPVIYSDVASGADLDRDQMNQLIDDIEAGVIAEVVTWEISRISRSLSFTADFIELCIEYNTSLRSLNDMFPTIRGEGDIMDEMMAKFAAWMTEFEREMIRLRVQSGVDRAIEQGKWTGRPPYGFTTNDDGYLRIDQEDYVAMSVALESVLTGEMSINEAARHLGVPKSTLSRTKNNEDRRKLYLYGDSDDDRFTEALDESGISPQNELAELQERIEKIEKEIAKDD